MAILKEANILFSGFTKETLEFFLSIRFNNNKEFMQAHRAEYLEQVRTPFYDLIDALAPRMLEISPEIEIRPHKCLSRIYRDIRFSRNKDPYRDHLWLAFRKAGVPKDGIPFYWFELSLEKVTWGLGVWGENKAANEILRKKMVARPDDFLKLTKLVNKHHFALGGKAWQRLPLPDALPDFLHPWYKKREMYFEKVDIPFDCVFDETLVDLIAKDFLSLRPLYLMLKGCTEEAMELLESL